MKTHTLGYEAIEHAETVGNACDFVHCKRIALTTTKNGTARAIRKAWPEMPFRYRPV
jgi:hypothetical protein